MCFLSKILFYSNVRIEIGYFDRPGGMRECHAVLHVTDTEAPLAKQLGDIHAAYFYLLSSYGGELCPVFKRYFLSDAANQIDALRSGEKPYPPCATSVVQQPPLDGGKVALWVYLLSLADGQIAPFEDGVTADHNGYRHIWTAYGSSPDGDSARQTETLLNRYGQRLGQFGCTLENDCVRTWFFVQNVDVNYAGVVRARRELFERHGLTPQTHYIASTGIEGRHADPNRLVLLDAYAVKGLRPGQQVYLHAKDHLNPTYEYGVTFERGVRLRYGDRSHILLSGTASIDNRGEIVAPQDIEGQTVRMLENVEALLAEAGASAADLAQMIVYLRDPADYPAVRKIFEQRYEAVPRLFVHAPVCRPGWLIETECIAVREDENPAFAPL